MTAQFQFFQSLPHKKADFVKKKPVELGVLQKHKFKTYIFQDKANKSISIDTIADQLQPICYSKPVLSIENISYMLSWLSTWEYFPWKSA